MVVDLREGGLVITPDAPLTRSVLVFGKALWGPTNEPVAVSKITEAEQIFGPLVDTTGEFTGTKSLSTYIHNEAILQVWEAFGGGCSDVRVVRLGLDGVKANLSLNITTTTPSDWLKIEAAHPGYIGNSIKVATCYTGEINPSALRIKIPTYFGGQTYKFELSDYNTIGELMDDVNRVMADFVFLSLVGQSDETFTPYYLPLIQSDTVDTYTSMVSAVALGTTPTSPGTYTGTAGTNDTTPTLASVYTALGDSAAAPGADPTALQNLREYEVDIIANSVYYVDEISGAGDDFMQRLVDFCHLQNKNGIPTACILGVSLLEPYQRSNVRSRVTDLLDVTKYPATLMQSGVASLSGEEDIENAGRYLQIIAGPHCMTLQRAMGWYATSAAVHIAAMRSQYPQHKPLTYKPVSGLLNIVYRFSNNEANDLLGGAGTVGSEGGAYIVLGQREGSIVPLGGPTCAKRNTDYQESYIIDTANAAVSAVRQVAQRYLGNPFGIAQRNAMSHQISTMLDGMYEAGALIGSGDVGYKFSISQTDQDRVLGRVIIDLALRPTLELKWIELTVSVQA
jgi:hypothetical protein